MRPFVVKENPGMAFGDIMRRLGDLWHALSDAEKGGYKAKAAALNSGTTAT
jgi:hypothetical protein